MSSIGPIEQFSRQYGGRVHFLMVYSREAHPQEGATEIIRNTKTLAQRRQVARDFARAERLSFPVVVDSMDNRAYHGFEVQTSGIFMLDGSGKIVFRSNTPPNLFNAAGLREALVKHAGPAS